jgi:GH25 family lysozyme M1 (1,4-beta-N-acetylmuramidase)
MATINLRVVDLYHGDRVSSFRKAADFGIWGVIHKATTGATGKDGKYHSRRKPALAAGMLWGAYHWGTDAHVGKQVDNFLKTSQPDDQTLVALDYEVTAGAQMSLDQAREFMTLVAQRLGRKPILYSGHLIKEELGNMTDAFFGSHRLWLAQYSPNPKVQKSWKTYWLWQYADKRTGLEPNEVPGIPGDSKGNLDCDSYSGSRDRLKAEWAS